MFNSKHLHKQPCLTTQKLMNSCKAHDSFLKIKNFCLAKVKVCKRHIKPKYTLQIKLTKNSIRGR